MHWIFVLVTFLTFPTTQSNPLTKAENENRLSTCGKNSKTKVYNGREVDRIEAPWTVYLKMENVTETGSMKSVSSTVCSGTVISPRHILTATHCFARLDEKIGLSGLKNGVLDRKKCDKDHYHIADPYILGNTYIMGDDVEQLDKYPEKVTLVNGCMSKELKKEIAMVQIDDFAIIHLSKELSFSDRVQQACVSNSETDHKPEMTLDYYGFGIKPNTTDISLDKSSAEGAGVLRHETIMCAGSMKSAGVPQFFVAADPYHKTVACSGDSGGGAVAKINQRTTVVGVLSQTTCDMQGRRIGPESGEIYASVAYYSTLVCQMTGVCGSGEYDKYHEGYGRKSQLATRPPVPGRPATQDSNGNIVNGDSNDSSDFFGWELVDGAMQGFSALVCSFVVGFLVVFG